MVITSRIPDDELGEAVALLVVLAGDSGVDHLRDWCMQRLPRYMVPRDIVSCPEIPRNPNGKFDRVPWFAMLLMKVEDALHTFTGSA